VLVVVAALLFRSSGDAWLIAIAVLGALAIRGR
jgi:hypothetical protein